MNNSRPDCVGVVIVNWNGGAYTVAACRSFDQSAHRDFKIIVVDNASADDSVAQLRAAVPEADLVVNRFNAGFAGGCNIGIRRALELGCNYVFLLNNDAMVESQTLTRLIEASRSKNDNALLGSALVFAGTGEYQFFGSRASALVDLSEYFSAETEAALLKQDFIETNFVIGAALFLPARVLEQTGLFDERFFLNYEETDLCYRARNLGIASFIVPASLVRHHGGATLGPNSAPMQAYFLTRNGLLFAERHGSPAQRRKALRSKLAILYWKIRKSWAAGTLADYPSRAMARAFLDYALRRFGDCPAAVRRYDAAYRGLTYIPSAMPAAVACGRSDAGLSSQKTP